jgi:hypothetical protein
MLTRSVVFLLRNIKWTIEKALQAVLCFSPRIAHQAFFLLDLLRFHPLYGRLAGNNLSPSIKDGHSGVLLSAVGSVMAPSTSCAASTAPTLTEAPSTSPPVGAPLITAGVAATTLRHAAVTRGAGERD